MGPAVGQAAPETKAAVCGWGGPGSRPGAATWPLGALAAGGLLAREPKSLRAVRGGAAEGGHPGPRQGARGAHPRLHVNLPGSMWGRDRHCAMGRGGRIYTAENGKCYKPELFTLPGKGSLRREPGPPSLCYCPSPRHGTCGRCRQGPVAARGRPPQVGSALPGPEQLHQVILEPKLPERQADAQPCPEAHPEQLCGTQAGPGMTPTQGRPAWCQGLPPGLHGAQEGIRVLRVAGSPRSLAGEGWGRQTAHKGQGWVGLSPWGASHIQAPA